MFCRFTIVVLIASLFAGSARAGHVPDHGDAASTGLERKPSWKDKFIDPEDGWPDLSGFLDDAAGFIPLAVPITEPAVGFGLAVVPVFINNNEDAPHGTPVKPNIFAVGGLWTDNGTEGYFGGHSGNWLDGNLQTTVGGAAVSVNLDFYGLGNQAVRYNIDVIGGTIEGRYRIGRSPFMAGLGYTYADMQISFGNSGNIPTTERFGTDSQIGSPKLLLSYDTRDNIFTPKTGSYALVSFGGNAPAFGASFTNQDLTISGMHYMQLYDDLFFGLKGDFRSTWGDTPFYALPFVQLRGVPAMRYQGENVAYAETELRWQFWKRLSLVGFAGAGTAWTRSGILEGSDEVLTGGGGFRYEIARRYNFHGGFDVGFSDEGDSAIYFTFGSAWGRP
jgi:hypothetical protein